MDRQIVAKAFLIVMLLGAIVSTVGMFVASGVDQDGPLYYALSATSMGLFLLVIIVASLFE